MTRRVPSWVGDRPPGRSGPAAPQRDQWAAGPIGRSSRAQATTTRALAYGLWGAIGLALLLGLVNCAGRPLASPPDRPTVTAAEPQAPPGGCAELTVAAWLAGDTELLAGVSPLVRGGAEPGRRRADHTYTLSAALDADPERWVYLVAAQVSERESTDDRWRAAGTQFYRVTLAPSSGGCGGWAPAALPARVPGPTLTPDGSTDYPTGLPVSGTPLSETLTAFFAALLTGDGELERYTAPGVNVPRFDPPPYQHIELIDLRAHADTPLDRSARVARDGTTARLQVTVATDPDGADLPLTYPVTVTVRGGRWEVVDIDSVLSPTMASPQPGHSP